MTGESEGLLSGSPWLVEELAAASNILVKSPSFGGGKLRACVDLVGVRPARDLNALVVSYTKSADRWLACYNETGNPLPQNTVVVSVGESMRSSAASGGGTSGARPLIPGEPVIDTLGNPSDLTGLGIKITEYLGEFDDARDAGGPVGIAFCFDSLTALLQYAEPERVFRFLHTLTTWIEQSNTHAIYYIDPDAHDAATIGTLEPLFDAIVDTTPGPEPPDWAIHTA